MFNLKEFLEMSEREQKRWLVNNGHIDFRYVKIPWSIVLADLAFRLRDEVCVDEEGIEAYCDALKTVYKIKYVSELISYEYWLETMIEAIDWIAAALQAKEQSDGN